MKTPDYIFEKHIGLNAELGYLPIEKEDVMNCINEALEGDYEYYRLKMKRQLLNAYIAGLQNESHWSHKWETMPLCGRIARIRKFLEWFNSEN